ncbi:unnamed protein product [Peronospora farinosa]|uniref:RxLR effector protein n=1 Tax=Peronospora farinosa TaxID=134698 RepID=A0ABN8CA21_9STRA|nr:unnamed protein product [Peronospora farinosa]
MLIALLAVTMAFADELSLTPQASDMPNVVHTRYLRSTANVTTNQQVDSGEGRRLVTSLAGLEGLPASLHQSVVKIFAKLRVRWWLWRQHKKTPDDVFKFLQLDKLNEQEWPHFSFVRVAQHLHTIFGSFTGTKMMNVLMKDDFAGSARRIKALLEYPVQKKWLKNPLA